MWFIALLISLMIGLAPLSVLAADDDDVAHPRIDKLLVFEDVYNIGEDD